MTRKAAEGAVVKWQRSHFGMVADFYIPADCNVIVLCVMGGSHYQLHPVHVLLPHQVYYKDCQELLKEHEAKEIVVIPANSKHYVELGAARLARQPRKPRGRG